MIDKDAQAGIQAILDAESLYPECSRKSREDREKDLLEWLERYKEVNRVYNLYGLDLVDAPSCDEYLDRGIFGRRRYLFNSDFRPLAYPDEARYSYSYAVFGRDKIVFDMFLAWAFGDSETGRIPCVGVVIGNHWYPNRADGNRPFIESDFVSFVQSYNGQRLVFKTAYGAGAHGVKVVSIEDGSIRSESTIYSPGDFLDLIGDFNVSWIVQEYLYQHETMSQFNASSVNTMRMVTFNTGTRVVFAPQVALRMGKPGSSVDNECYYTSVDATGRAYEYAFSYFEMLRVKNHCAGVQVPYFEEAKEMVTRLHSLLPGLFTIGWDVAISSTGPVIIEANDGWEPFLCQTRIGNGMRGLWNEMEKERIAYLGYEPSEPK